MTFLWLILLLFLLPFELFLVDLVEMGLLDFPIEDILACKADVRSDKLTAFRLLISPNFLLIKLLIIALPENFFLNILAFFLGLLRLNSFFNSLIYWLGSISLISEKGCLLTMVLFLVFFASSLVNPVLSFSVF